MRRRCLVCALSAKIRKAAYTFVRVFLGRYIMKKLISILIAAVITASAFISSIPAAAVSVAEEGEPRIETYDSCVDWKLDSEGTLTISGTGRMNDYKYFFFAPWTRYASDIKAIVVEEGVESIGDYAFYGCSSAKSISIPASVTSIGGAVFTDCGSVETVTVASGNSVYHSDGNCIIETASKTLVAGFNSSVIPDDGSVTSIGGGAFSQCDALTDIDIPEGVTAIGKSAFYECSSLASADLPDSLTSIGADAFYKCESLEEITIPGGVGAIGASAFRYCKQLRSVTIEEGVVTIGDVAFDSCSSLTSIEIPASVTDIGELAFGYCAGLEKITVAEGNTVYHSSGNCLIKTADKTLIAGCKRSVIPSDGSVVSIGEFAFYGQSYLESLDIPYGVTSIEKDAFQNCTGLTSVTISGSVAEIGDRAFCRCTSLKSVVIPDSVTSISAYAFGECTDLTSVTIPGSVTKICEGAFKFCTSLENITIPDGVKTIELKTFESCKSLENIIIPKSLTFISADVFLGCRSLTDIYYAGTEEEWSKVEVYNLGNDYFKEADVYFDYTGQFLPGDVTGDGNIRMSDVLLLRKYISGVA